MASRRRPTLREVVPILKETATDWQNDQASRLAAALACYTLLSIAPMIVLSVIVAGWIFGEEAARGQIGAEIGKVVGAQAGQAIQAIIANAHAPGAGGILGTVVGIVVLLFGASGVFGELQSALNSIWEVEPKPGRGMLGMVRDRFFSFAMVLGVAFLLLVSLVLSAALAALGYYFEQLLPGGEAVWRIVNFLVAFAATSLLFALIFKVVPDVKVAWRDVWVGAVATSLLFTLGKLLLALYIGRSSVASSFGAAGSLAALVVWVYYSSQVLFFGAEFTQVYARRYGSRIEPSENAVLVDKAHPKLERNQELPPRQRRLTPAN